MPILMKNFKFSPNPLPRGNTTVTVQLDASVKRASENQVKFQLTFAAGGINEDAPKVLTVNVGASNSLQYQTNVNNSAANEGTCTVRVTAKDANGGVFSLNKIINYE